MGDGGFVTTEEIASAFLGKNAFRFVGSMRHAVSVRLRVLSASCGVLAFGDLTPNPDETKNQAQGVLFSALNVIKGQKSR